MGIDEDLLEPLRAYGLSDYAARAYLALLELGETQARDVARVAAVPVTKVHATLGALHEMGLVEIVPDTPRRYAPVPFELYLDALRLDHLDRARDIEAARERLAARFRVRGETPPSDRGGIALVRGRRATLARMARVLARHDAAAPLYLATRGDADTGRMRRALARDDVDTAGLRVLMPAGGERAMDDAQVRIAQRAGACDVALLVAGSHAILAHMLPDDASLRRGEDLALVVERASLVDFLRELAERRWDGAKPPAEELPVEVASG